MVFVIVKRLLYRVLVSVLELRRRRALFAVGALLAVGLLGAGVYAGFSLFPRGAAGLSSASEMSVDRLEQNPSTGQILLVLKEKAGNRRLAMVVGDTEARTIFVQLQGARSERPMTYDLMGNLVQRLGGRVSYVIVNHVSDTTFFAKVFLASQGQELEVDSRPSDAIALAMRVKAPIYVDLRVLEKAGIAAPN